MLVQSDFLLHLWRVIVNVIHDDLFSAVEVQHFVNILYQVLLNATAQYFGIVIEMDAHVAIIELHANAVLFAEIDPLHHPNQLGPIFITFFYSLRVGVGIITSLLAGWL